MKHIIALLAAVVLLTSCGTDGSHFKLEGKFSNLNSGEFYAYSPDGGINGIDTIKMTGGKFSYEVECDKKATMMLVFPNFVEQPIFMQPGKTAKVKGDASRLKEMEVTGTKENEKMNVFREMILKASPPEEKKYAEQFIKDNPESMVGVYLVNKYFIKGAEPDYKKAFALIDIMTKEQPKNGELTRLYQQIKPMSKMQKGDRLPAFAMTAANGGLASSAILAAADVAVLNTWASWSFESMDIQRKLKRLRQDSGYRLKVISISLDASKKECNDVLRRDSISWQNICDEQMFDGKLIRQLGMFSVPDNIIIKNGQIVARSLNTKELEDKIKELLALK